MSIPSGFQPKTPFSVLLLLWWSGKPIAIQYLTKSCDLWHSKWFSGYCENPDDVVVVGDLEELKFSAYLCEGDEVKAVVSTSNVTAAFAEYISAGNKLSKREVEADATSWLSQVPKGKLWFHQDHFSIGLHLNRSLY